MALVVLLRGVNVGGHKAFKPTALVAQLKHLDVVNIGAAGTFVVRKSITQAKLRAELKRALPFDTEVAIVSGSEILKLIAKNPFAGEAARPDLVPFVSTLCKRPRSLPDAPVNFPVSGQWTLKILSCDNRFVCGVYRRQMDAIKYLGTLDRLLGVPVTTRNWNTINAIAKVLESARTGE
jgi:uncharacterized protein (DUF1697 family)